VTGATGFVGRALVARLQADGAEVIALGSRDADLRDPASLERFADVSLDRVYHLAAWTQAGDFCLTHSADQWIVNQLINTTVLQWWARYHRGTKLVSLGTSCAYAEGSGLREDEYLVGTPIADLYTYAMTKRMLHIGQMSVATQLGGRYLTLVPSTLYGPGYHDDTRQMHFIFDIIRKVLDYDRTGEPVVLWGDGHQTRELVFIDDFVRDMLAVDAVVNDDVVNLGAGVEHSIREFAHRVCAIVGVDSRAVQYDVSRYVGARSKCLDVTKVRRILPERRLTPLDEGLRITVEWMRERRRP